MDEETVAEIVVDFSTAAKVVFAAGTVEATLQQVVQLATGTIEGCDFAGIFIQKRRSVTTWVHTDPVVQEMDALQQQTGQGPCLDASVAGEMCYAEDLSDDSRWAVFGPLAAARGVRSALGLHVASGEDVGALNLYARYPRAFGVIDRGKAVILAMFAGVAIASAQEHEDEQRRIEGLTAALASREVIGQAQGILMERERVTGIEAFDILRRASQHLNRKLREVAQDLVDTGERPEAGTSRGAASGP